MASSLVASGVQQGAAALRNGGGLPVEKVDFWPRRPRDDWGYVRCNCRCYREGRRPSRCRDGDWDRYDDRDVDRDWDRDVDRGVDRGYYRRRACRTWSGGDGYSRACYDREYR